ncbi:hypothetical protein cypCar_00043286 [Cyprinus carpio]|nr:hypothetical protein cypCar_00043286 [Cyprinus carpio]
MRRQYLEAQEKSRLQAIEDRRKRIASHEEPIDGVPIKFKFPHGSEKIRKFILSESIQDDLSSEVFYVQDATSSAPLENNLTGTLNDYNIKGHSTLYVVWISPLDSHIKEADSVEHANSAISDAGDSLYMMGALRYISSLEERDSLVQSAAEYFVNGRTNLALRQFEEGFKTLGLIQELKNHPDIFEDLFINAVRPLEAKDLSTLFEVDFSPLGSNKRQLENKTVCFWRDWLIDVEGKQFAGTSCGRHHLDQGPQNPLDKL